MDIKELLRWKHLYAEDDTTEIIVRQWIDAIEAVMQEKDAEAERLKDQIAIARGWLQETEAKNERLKEEIAVCRDRIIELDLDLDDCSADDERFQTQLDAKEDEIERLKKSAEEAIRLLRVNDENSGEIIEVLLAALNTEDKL